MLLSLHNILNLPVETQSNQRLGRVAGAIVDVETQSLHQYRVAPGGISHLFSKEELLIDRDQVISITKEKMVVEDSVGRAIEEEAVQFVKNKPRLSAEVVTQNQE